MSSSYDSYYYHLWESGSPGNNNHNASLLASSFPTYPYQVTVTDADQDVDIPDHLELDFRSPSPSLSDQDQDDTLFSESGGGLFSSNSSDQQRRPPPILLPRARLLRDHSPLPPLRIPSPPQYKHDRRTPHPYQPQYYDDLSPPANFKSLNQRRRLGPLLRTQSPSPPPSSRGSSPGGIRSSSEPRTQRSSSSHPRSPRDSGRRRRLEREEFERHYRRKLLLRDKNELDMSKLIVGPVRSNIYEDEITRDHPGQDDYQRSESRMSRGPSPQPDRPSWGFAPISQVEGEYLDYDSDESNYSTAAANTSRRGRPYESDSDDDSGFNRSNASRRSNRGRDASPSKGSKKRSRSKVREGIDQYRALKVTLYKNGDPWFGSKEYRFIPGKDAKNLDGLFNKVTEKLDFMNAISYMFDTEGRRITGIDQIENGGEYVMATSKKFAPANYGKTGEDFEVDGGANRKKLNKLKRISYNKKGTSSAPTGKPGSGDGKIIKIVNAEDYDINERVLLNLRTTQSFEEVVKDLGQVLKIRKANKLYSKKGKEIRSFSHLKLDFPSESTFFVSNGPARIFGYESEEESDYDDDLDVDDGYGRSANGRSRLSGRAASEPGRNDRSRSVSRDRSDRNSTEAIQIKIRGGKRKVYPPSSGHYENIRKPGESLELDWVYGYKGRREKRNLWLVNEGELLYYIGSIAVVFNRVNESQKQYTGHTEDIQCMDLHPSREYVVSGQKRGKGSESWAHIRIWSVLNLETKVVLGMGELNYGVAAVAFSTMSRGGDFVMCVDESKENTMSIWDWKKKDLVGRSSTDHSSTNGCAFHPFDSNLTITYGKNHLVFWNRKKDGFFERSDLLKSTRHITCHEFLDSGDFVTGDTDGMICSYSVSNEGEYYMSKEIEAHKKGGVNCLLKFSEHTIISGGDRDGKIASWDSTRDFQKMSESSLPEDTGCARTIVPQKTSKTTADNTLYVGTTDNIIVEGSIQRKFKILLWSHAGEIRGLAPHPDDLAFVTAGSDKTIAKWRKQKVAWLLTLKVRCISAAYHPSGTTVAVGTDDGHLVVLNGDTGNHIVTIKVCGSPLTAIRFSGDGETVALASQSGSIYLYTTSREGRSFKKYGKMPGRSDHIQQMDWSKSGEYLQTVSAEQEVAYWNVKTNKLERAGGSSFRDEAWLDQTCTVSYATAGAWNNINYKNDDSEVTGANVGKFLVLAGDSDGFVRMFRSPCSTAKAEFHESKIGSDPITGVRFLFDDIYALATAGADAALVRWKIK